MGRSRLELRKMAEAAEKNETASTKKATKKKRATKRKTTTRAKRAKDAPVRKKIVWTVFSGSMKEEARFPYDQKAEAEAKLEQLRSKSKKLYFLQPVKEPITDDAGGPVPDEAAPQDLDEEVSADLPDDEDAVADDDGDEEE